MRPFLLAALAFSLVALTTAYADDPPKETPKEEPKEAAGGAERSEALAKLMEGKGAEAEEILKKRIAEQTEDFGARTILGRILAGKGDQKGAEEQFRKVVEYGDDFEEAGGRLAELLAGQGKHAEAVKMAEDTIKKYPDALIARVALGGVQLETGKGDDAEKTLGWLREFVGKSTKLTGEQKFACGRGLWPLALRLGDKDLMHFVVDANELLNEALDGADTPDAEVLAYWGHCYMDKYNGVYAKHNFEDALKIDPKCASAIFGMARVLGEGGKMPQALAAVDKALEINPVLFDALLFKAEVQGGMQQLVPSETTIRAALKINPKSVKALSMLASIYETQGKTADREKTEVQLKEINPNCGLAWYLIGSALGNKMLFDEAQVYLKKSVEADPKLWDAYTEYGMNALRLGDEVTGLKYLTEAYERDPFNIRLVNTMTLMDSFPKDFRVIETKHFRIRMHKSEIDLIGPYVVEVHERAWDELAKRYNFEPQVPIVSDMYPNHNDFSVRTVGMSGLGALGACFGKMITLLSPRAKEVMGKFNWGSVVWHELGHVWALQISRNRCPRWFTEGLSTYEEKLGYPGWDRELEVEIFQGFHGKKLMKIKDLANGGDLLNLYLFGSLINEYIATKWGFDTNVKMLKLWGEGKDTDAVFQAALGMTTDKFDTDLQAWIGNWLKGVGLRLGTPPTKEELAKLEKEVKDNPMDAAGMGRLSRIYAIMGNKADAETLAKKALKLDEANIDALCVLAESMGTAERRRFDKAAELYGKAIAAGATDFQTRMQYATMLIKADKPDEAIPSLEEAKKSFPRYIGPDNPYEKLMDIYRERKDDANLLKQLEQFLAINHDSFRPRIEAAEFYIKSGDRDKVISTLESALYIGVFDARLHAWLGRAYRDAEKFEKAAHEFKAEVILLEEAEKKAPGKWQMKISEFKAEEAAMRFKLGKMEDARVLAKDALLSDPSNTLARKVLEDLEKK